MKPGDKVKTLRSFAGVPQGSEGFVIEIEDGVVVIGWDLPERPFKPVLPIHEYGIGQMMAVDEKCPLRDGFSESDLRYLELVKQTS